MIVRVLDDRIQLMTQPDHAHLARTIMESCGGLGARPRRNAILLATGEHDNGWDVEDARQPSIPRPAPSSTSSAPVKGHVLASVGILSACAIRNSPDRVGREYWQQNTH